MAILYQCDNCRRAYDFATRIGVTNDGRWLCAGCYDGSWWEAEHPQAYGMPPTIATAAKVIRDQLAFEIYQMHDDTRVGEVQAYLRRPVYEVINELAGDSHE